MNTIPFFNRCPTCPASDTCPAQSSWRARSSRRRRCGTQSRTCRYGIRQTFSSFCRQKRSIFFQFFAGLDSTGDVDPTTASLLTRPRCGVPDVTHSGRNDIQQLYYSTFLYFTDASFQDFKTGVAASATACRASGGPGPT